MFQLKSCLGVALIAAVVACCMGDAATAEVPRKTVQAPALSTGPGGHNVPMTPRGGGGNETYAGIPECVPNINNAQVGIQGGFTQECDDGQWVSLGFPVVTNGATIESINMIHNTNSGEGDLYLMGDCGGNPDINNILWIGCGCIEDTVSGAVTNYCIGDPIVDPPATVWVVPVFRDDFSFDVAFDDTTPGTNRAFVNLTAGGTGNCGDWTDLDAFGFGFCYWVSLVEGASPGAPECCDSAAMCDGDANGDGVVDPLDTGGILSRFGLDAADPDNCQYDVNCDGVIDPLDTGYVLSRFGGCNPPPDACPLGGGTPGDCPGGGEGCGAASCPGPPADCCEVHSEPGCDSVCGEPDDGFVEDCVCDIDDFCCDFTWDAGCVEIVEFLGCADCSDNNPDCADDEPPACNTEIDCCFANGTPGCEDQACQDLICGQDPFCCDTEWDQICADAACNQCEVCGGGGGGDGADDCADAIDISDGVTAFSTVGATTDGPALPGSCDEGFGLDFGQDIWYHYTASCSGTVTVSTCNDADYDTRTAAYLGTNCVGDFVACNDDGDGCNLFTSILEFSATSGTVYKLRIGGFGAASGTGNLTISCN